MLFIVSRVRRLEARAEERSGLLLQPWAVGADGRATTALGAAQFTQVAGEALAQFQERVAEAMHPRRRVVWISEKEAAL